MCEYMSIWVYIYTIIKTSFFARMDSVQVFILIYYFNLFSNIFHQQLEYFMVKQQTNKPKPKIHTWLEFHKDQIRAKPYFSQTKF